MTAAEHHGGGAEGAAAPGHGAVEDHLAALDAALHGPARVKSRMLAEVRDGLTDAADAHAEAGAPSPPPRRPARCATSAPWRRSAPRSSAS